jgi:hypothetical protein
MGLFKTKSELPDIERFLKKKKYAKLIKLLNHENQEIVKQAINALNQLAEEKDAILQREKFWSIYNYKAIFKKLDSIPLKSIEAQLKPFQNKMLTEQDALIAKANRHQEQVVAFRKMFKEFGFTHAPGINFLNRLFEKLDSDEEVEYGQSLGIGEHWMTTNNGMLLTNKRLIYFDESGIIKIIPIGYTEIKEIKKGFMKTKIIAQNGSMVYYPTSEQKLTELIERKVQAAAGK